MNTEENSIETLKTLKEISEVTSPEQCSRTIF